jgi:hypothetical protein
MDAAQKALENVQLNKCHWNTVLLDGTVAAGSPPAGQTAGASETVPVSNGT